MGQALAGYSQVSQVEGEPARGVIQRLPCFRWCFPELTAEQRFEVVQRRFLTEGGVLVMMGEDNAAESVLVQLGEDGKQLEWRSLALVRNKPKSQGVIPVTAIQAATAVGDSRRIEMIWSQASTFRLTSRARRTVFEADSDAEFGRWADALGALVHVWKPQLEEAARAAQQQRNRRAAREQEMQDRRKGREERKRALGLDKVGMKYTAQALASR